MSHLENQLDNMFNSGESERESLIKELEPLRAENAKLKMLHNAEIALADMLKCRVNELEAERDEYLANKILDASDKKLLDRLLAEREAMMNQEPVGYAVEIYWRSLIDPGDCGEGLEIWSVEDFIRRAEHDISDENVFPVYAKPHPLPAQQIPEGYAIEILRKVFDLYESGVDCYDSEDHYSAAYMGRCIRLDDDLFKSCVDLLSASQPKGDL